MPKVAMSDDEEMIVTQWLLAEGDTFAEGQPLLEVETAKASMEIEAPDAGVLAVQVRKAGDSLQVGGLEALDPRPRREVDGRRVARVQTHHRRCGLLHRGSGAREVLKHAETRATLLRSDARGHPRRYGRTRTSSSRNR